MSARAFIDEDQPPLPVLAGPGVAEAAPDEIEDLLLACVAAQPIDKLDGMPLVRMRKGEPCLPIVTVQLDAHSYTLTADHGRRVARGLSEMGRGGAALDLMQLCDDAEAAAAAIAGAH